MKSFLQYINEVIEIVPASSRIAEPLPHGFSIKLAPENKPPKKKPTNKPQQPKPRPPEPAPRNTQNLTFAERLRLAQERSKNISEGKRNIVRDTLATAMVAGSIMNIAPAIKDAIQLTYFPNKYQELGKLRLKYKDLIKTDASGNKTFEITDIKDMKDQKRFADLYQQIVDEQHPKT